MKHDFMSHDLHLAGTVTLRGMLLGALITANIYGI